MSIFRRLWNVVRRTRLDDDIRQELDTHLALIEEEERANGSSADLAHQQARVRFGSPLSCRERALDAVMATWLENAGREIVFAARRLMRSPAFTSATVLSLALAIAANVSIFTVAERVVLHPLPYPDSGRLLALDFSMVARHIPAGFNSITSRQYVHYADHARALGGLTIYHTEDRTLTEGGTPERIRIARTTSSFASVLGVAPVIGRWLTEDEGAPGGPPVAVLSHGLWSRRYAQDPSLLGRPVMLNGIPTIVVGVMPASFAFPDSHVDAWLAEPMSRATVNDSFSFFGVARLRDGATLADARADITQLTRTLDATAPGNGYVALGSTALTLQHATVGPIATALWMLLASAGVLLVVACANIANLFLVRSEARQREIGVRRALGAGTGGIAGYFLAESTLLSLAGGLLGVGVAWYGVRLLVAFGPTNLPRLNEVRLAPISVAFTVVLSVLAALVFGVVPLMRLGSARVTLHEDGRGTTASRRSHRTRQLLMGGQVALALVLLVASGLLIRSFQRLRAVDPGFDPSSALTFQIGLPRSDYPDRRTIVATHQAILDRVSSVPGVTAASVTTCLPLSGRGFCGGAPLFVDGEVVTPASGAIRPIVAIRPVAGSFFDAMGMRVIRGRAITRRDVETNEPVAVVNDAFVREGLPHQDPLGTRVRLGPHTLVPGPPLWFTIVGVVKTTPTVSLGEPLRVSKMYVPMFATRDVWPAVDVMTYVVRTASSPLALAPAARAAVNDIDPNLALAQVRTLQDFLDVAASQRAFTLILLVIAASTALLLGVIGIYGVTSYIVSQRTNEIGIRLALGAEPSSVMGLIVKQGGLVAVGGIAAGVATALAGGRLMESLLYGVSPRDPGVFGVTTLTLLTIALVACWLPARRAASVDPLVALRAE